MILNAIINGTCLIFDISIVQDVYSSSSGPLCIVQFSDVQYPVAPCNVLEVDLLEVKRNNGGTYNGFVHIAYERVF